MNFHFSSLSQFHQPRTWSLRTSLLALLRVLVYGAKDDDEDDSDEDEESSESSKSSGDSSGSSTESSKSSNKTGDDEEKVGISLTSSVEEE